MKKVTVIVNEEYTSVCVIKENKNGEAKLLRHCLFDPLLEYMLNEDSSSVCKIFNEIREEMNLKNEKVYLSIPNSLLRGINSFSIDSETYMTNENLLLEKAYKGLNIAETERENYFIDYPLVFKVNDKTKDVIKYSVCCIKTSYVDNIISAADAAKINIVSIEPEEIAITRFIESMENPFNIMTISKSTASIFTYVPDFGISLIRDITDISYMKLLHSLTGVSDLSQSIMTAVAINSETYELEKELCLEWPIYINSIKSKEIYNWIQNNMKDEFADLFIELNGEDCFSGNEVIEDESNYYPIAFGLLLKDTYERMNEENEDEEKNISDTKSNIGKHISSSRIHAAKENYRDFMQRISNFFRHGSNL